MHVIKEWVELYLHSFLTWALGVSEWLTWSSGHFTQGKNPSNYWIGGWVGSRSRVYFPEKGKVSFHCLDGTKQFLYWKSTNNMHHLYSPKRLSARVFSFIVPSTIRTTVVIPKRFWADRTCKNVIIVLLIECHWNMARQHVVTAAKNHFKYDCQMW